MAECEGLALVTFARNENRQDGQGGLARVGAVAPPPMNQMVLCLHQEHSFP